MQHAAARHDTICRPLMQYAAERHDTICRFKVLSKNLKAAYMHSILLLFCLKYGDLRFQSAHIVPKILRRTV